jgi:hypothetical protein
VKKKERSIDAATTLVLINRIEQVAKTLEDLSKCVFGNGTPGLKADMITLQAQIRLATWLLGACVLGIVVPIVIKILGGV